MITVAQLIEQLKRLDPALPVTYINCGSGMLDGLTFVEHVEVCAHKDPSRPSTCTARDDCKRCGATLPAKPIALLVEGETPEGF